MHEDVLICYFVCVKISITCEFHFHSFYSIERLHLKRSFLFDIASSDVEKLVCSCIDDKEKERSFNNKQCTTQAHWIVFLKYYKCHEHSGTLEWKTVENITAIDKLIQIFISYVLEAEWEQAKTNHWHFRLAIVWHQIGFQTILWVVFRPRSPRTPF